MSERKNIKLTYTVMDTGYQNGSLLYIRGVKKVFRALTVALLVAACEQPAGPMGDPPSDFVEVAGIRGAPLGGKRGVALNLGAAAVTPEDATRQDIDWELLDGGTTGVTDEDLTGGSPVPRAAGALKLRAVVAGGLGDKKDYTQDITVAIIDDAVSGGFVAVEGIAGVPLGGMKGEALDLGAAAVMPEGATRQDIHWIFLDGGSTGITEEDLAELSLIPPAAGTLRLLAVVNGGRGEGEAYTQEITITIADEVEDIPYSITIGSLANGSVAADPVSTTAGTEIALTTTPDAGYILKAGSVTVNNGAVAVNGSGSAYSFVMPAENVTAHAEFEAILYAVSIEALTKGSVIANPSSAAAGTEITLTAAPDAGYTLKAGSVKANNGAVAVNGSGAVYIFVMPLGDVAVAAEFEALPEGSYTVGIGELRNGTINPEPTSAAAGTTIALTVSPSTGYALKAGSVKVNNGAVAVSGSGSAYRFVMPAGNVTASA
jgi:hypothetical protein